MLPKPGKDPTIRRQPETYKIIANLRLAKLLEKIILQNLKAKIFQKRVG